MIVLFPEPEAPTMAVVLPSSNVAVNPSSTFYSGRVGYLKVTLLNSMCPLTSPTGYDFGSSRRIFGTLSIISNAAFPATLPSVRAFIFGVACPSENTP
jgi:hypothetical protein